MVEALLPEEVRAEKVAVLTTLRESQVPNPEFDRALAHTRTAIIGKRLMVGQENLHADVLALIEAGNVTAFIDYLLGLLESKDRSAQTLLPLFARTVVELMKVARKNGDQPMRA